MYCKNQVVIFTQGELMKLKEIPAKAVSAVVHGAILCYALAAYFLLGLFGKKSAESGEDLS